MGSPVVAVGCQVVDRRGTPAEFRVSEYGCRDSGRCSMLSFASAAFGADGTLVGTYTANLEALPEAVADPDTMAW
ncbi:hypothetical protein Areg01_25610 [Actinoplanes regularis]|nr:hypothetical protein Areg01_25610 [Actinoplanes regularis]